MTQVNYTFPEDLGKPILQIQEARKAKAFHKVAPGMDHQSSLKDGQSMEDALEGCQHQIRGGSWGIPSQLHFYMEPQTALAQGDGEGGMEVKHPSPFASQSSAIANEQPTQRAHG